MKPLGRCTASEGRMKERLVTLFGIAFVVAVIATGVFYGLIVSRMRTPVEASTAQQVVVAARPLDRGAVVGKGDVRTISWSGKNAPAGAVSRVEQVIGATLKESVAENDAISEPRVITPKSIPPGMRVISIHATDSSGVVAMLRPGHRVDVQVVAGGRAGDVSIRTILQGVEVLSVSPSDGGRPVLNLVVTARQADLLGLADTVARLRVVLRNDKDAATPASAGIPSSQLLGAPVTEASR